MKRRTKVLIVLGVVYLFLSSTYVTDLRYRVRELEHRVDSLVEFNIDRLAGIEVKTEYLIDRVLNAEMEKEMIRVAGSRITVVPRGN